MGSSTIGSLKTSKKLSKFVHMFWAMFLLFHGGYAGSRDVLGKSFGSVAICVSIYIYVYIIIIIIIII